MTAIEPVWADELDRRCLTGVGERRLEATLNRSRLRAARRFRTLPVEVLAMFHDGTTAQAEAIATWVSEHRDGLGSSGYVTDGAVVVIVRPWRADLLEVAAGQHLVCDRRDPARWRVYGGDQFSVCFAAQPRELAIFDDGEVA